MDIDITQPFSHKIVIVNELNYLIIICAGCQRKVLKEREDFRSVFEVPACQFTNNKWVTNYLAII